MKTRSNRVYAVFLLNSKYWKDINKELKNRGYKGIRATIPSVSILKKKKAGKVYYNQYPMLFDYGFMRMSSRKAFDRIFLNKLRREIPGIKGWVRDSFTMHPRKKRKRIDNAEDWDDFSKVAIVTKEEVELLKKISLENSIFDYRGLINMPIGSYVILRGYPFDGIGGILEDISLSTKTAKVILYPDSIQLHIEVSLDNLLYSPYLDSEVPEDFISKHKPVYLSEIDHISTT